MSRFRLVIVFLVASACFGSGPAALASDWPQFLRDSQHTGDAAEELLSGPLKLLCQTKLDDAVLTSPVVVDGQVFVVDQMGTVYCVDPAAQRIIWKSSPEGPSGLGGNTSSPCVAEGRLFFGTTAGNLHILEARSGKRIKTIEYGQPILDSVTQANDSVYVQTLDAVVHCLDFDGNCRWRWDHYNVLAGTPASGSKPQYGGVAVSVAGRRVVMAVGYDLVCVEDRTTEAKHLWTLSEPLSKTFLPVATSICGEFVYCAFPGKDGKGAVLRVSLEDGSFDKRRDVLQDQWAVMAAPAVRGQTAYYSREAFGVSTYRFGDHAATLWDSFGDDAEGFTPSLSAPVLSQNRCLFTTLYGDFIAVDLATKGRGLDGMTGQVDRFRTPYGSAISSSPAIADGRVYFGCDDGYLYGLGHGENVTAQQGERNLSQRRSQVVPAGRGTYAWPSAFGGSRNANFVEDDGFQPPFALKWAARSGGLFKQPVCATEQDVIYVTLGGLVVCREQQTGRLRWRRKLPNQAWCRSALLCADGKVFVPRMFSLRYPKVQSQGNALYCLDGETGDILWEQPIGIGDRLRASPVFADGIVAFGSFYREEDLPRANRDLEAAGQTVEGWDAATGRRLWRVGFRSTGQCLNGPAGCAGDGVLFFAGGGESPRATGETMAIAPQTGKILWRTSEAFASQTGTPSFQDGKIYLPGAYKLPLACLSAADGRILWLQDEGLRHWFVDTVSLGPDYFTVKNKYQGGALRWNLADGTMAGTADGRIQLWGPAHACGSVVLTSQGTALSATINGLYLTDARTGQVLWESPGFACYACPHAIVSNGRIFYAPQTNGAIYCFEPKPAE